MATLPSTAASSVCRFLSGLDALSLSHCNSFWLQHLDVSLYWQSVLPPKSDPLHPRAYKALYLRSRSIEFQGGDSYAFVSSFTGHKKTQISSFRDCNFSFDVWFALLPQDTEGSCIGGVLYGLQSEHPQSRVWPKFHQQFVLVSTSGNLYCSVIDYRPVVKSSLKSGRWYRLALTYDVDSQCQKVYVDGEKVRSDVGTLHREMEFLKYEQVGTGCITANALDLPTPGYLGWYGFRGLVDEFRIWDGVLTEEEVKKLATGENGDDKMLLGTLKVSGRVPRGSRWNVCEVRCSRPMECRQLQLVKKSSRSRLAIVRPEQLPADTVKTLCSFLTGFDAFNLSHTNYWWWQYLSDGALWRACFAQVSDDAAQEQAESSWKKQYMLSRSMLFRGLRDVDDRHVDSYSYLTEAGRDQRRPSRFRLNFLGSESFTFDVCFSLLPASDGESFGGIIYGLQSASRESRKWPYYHQQFILISSTGDLYCSVLDSRPVVASNLSANRWHHLALTYDSERQHQVVYLDGVNVHSSTGALHNEWGFLTNEQVGTGCITAGSLNFPRPNYLGWYGFHGIIDDFRIWSGAFRHNDVAILARGGVLRNDRMRASVKVDTSGERVQSMLTWVNVQLTMCTRPTEGKSMQVVGCRSTSQSNCIIS